MWNQKVLEKIKKNAHFSDSTAAIYLKSCEQLVMNHLGAVALENLGTQLQLCGLINLTINQSINQSRKPVLRNHVKYLSVLAHWLPSMMLVDN